MIGLLTQDQEEIDVEARQMVFQEMKEAGEEVMEIVATMHKLGVVHYEAEVAYMWTVSRGITLAHQKNDFSFLRRNGHCKFLCSCSLVCEEA